MLRYARLVLIWNADGGPPSTVTPISHSVTKFQTIIVIFLKAYYWKHCYLKHVNTLNLNDMKTWLGLDPSRLPVTLPGCWFIDSSHQENIMESKNGSS